jgi:hypothetical protein
VQGLDADGRLEGRARAVVVGLVEAQPAQLGVDIGGVRVALQRAHQRGGRFGIAAGLAQRHGGVQQRAGFGGVFGGQRHVGRGGEAQVASEVKGVGVRGRKNGPGLKQQK